MATSDRLPEWRHPRAEPRYRKVPEVALYDRDDARRAGASAYRAIEAKGEVIRRALQLSNPGRVSERMSVAHDSPLSKTIEEATRLERAGIDSTVMSVTLLRSAMIPTLQALDTAELEELMDDLYVKETEIQAQLDTLQMQRKCGVPVDCDEEYALWSRQASVSVRALAVRGLLNRRAAGGRR